MTMRFASMCSGFGLADIGAMQAGYEPVYACETSGRVHDAGR